MSSHTHLHAATVARAANTAWTPALADSVAAITAAFARIPTAQVHGPKRAWPAHLLLSQKAGLAALTEACTALGNQLATPLPTSWGMQGWGIRISTTKSTATWSARGGKGQRGITHPLTGEHLAWHAGWMTGLTWAHARRGDRPEPKDWAALCPESANRSDWPFVVGVEGERRDLPILSLRGQDPRDAWLQGLASGRCPRPVPPTNVAPDDAFFHGFTTAAHTDALPVLWFGGAALWAPLFHTPVAQRLMGGTQAAPDDHMVHIRFAAIRAYMDAEYKSITPAQDHPTMQTWRRRFLADTQTMARLRVLVALAGPPQAKRSWTVDRIVLPDRPKPYQAWGARPPQPAPERAVVEAKGWCVASALLHQALTSLQRGEPILDLHTWQAWDGTSGPDAGAHVHTAMAACTAPSL